MNSCIFADDADYLAPVSAAAETAIGPELPPELTKLDPKTKASLEKIKAEFFNVHAASRVALGELLLKAKKNLQITATGVLRKCYCCPVLRDSDLRVPPALTT